MALLKQKITCTFCAKESIAQNTDIFFLNRVGQLGKESSLVRDL